MWVRTGGFLYVAGFVFMIAIIVGIFVQSNVYYLVISCVGALLFSAYLLFDLQLIMGGAHPTLLCAPQRTEAWPCRT